MSVFEAHELHEYVAMGSRSIELKTVVRHQCVTISFQGGKDPSLVDLKPRRDDDDVVASILADAIIRYSCVCTAQLSTTA